MEKKRKAVVVDLDGTLFKDEFKKLIPEVITEKTWQEFHKKVDYYKDVPVDEIVEKICRNLLASGVKIIFLTAREEESMIKHNTRMAIYDLFFEHKNNYEIVMRPLGNKQTAPKMKLGMMKDYILPRHEVQLAIDDCHSNIEIFQSLNIPTMLYRSNN